MNRKFLISALSGLAAILATIGLCLAARGLQPADLSPLKGELDRYAAATSGASPAALDPAAELHAMALAAHGIPVNPWTRGSRKDYYTLLSDVEAGQVTALGVMGRDLYVSAASGRFVVPQKNLPPLADGARVPPRLWAAVESHRVQFAVLESPGDEAQLVAVPVVVGVFLVSHLGDILMSLFLVAGLAMVLRTLRAGSASFKVEQERPTLKFSDVIGATEAKEALDEVRQYLTDSTPFARIGARVPRGVLMTGEPGTGKTLLARALAGECAVSFISVNGSSFSNKFLGAGIERVKTLFAAARKSAPCIVFIDEFDGLGQRSANSDGQASTSENNRIINQLLVELDGFAASAGVVVIGATNHPASIDPALLREGRIDRVCRISLPTIGEREELFRHYLGKFVVSEPPAFRRYARFSAGMSPVAIATVCNQAALGVVKRRGEGICSGDIDAALDANRMGGLTPGIELDDKNRRCVAHHEAGHALLAKLLNVGLVDKVSIAPRSGGSLGVTLVTKDHEIPLQREAELLARLEMLLAGRCAEELFCGEVTTGAGSDLEEASRLAMAMVSNYGFGRNGLFSLAGMDVKVPDAVLRDAIADSNRLLEEARQRAMARLRKHRAALNQIACELLEHETIPGSSVDQALADWSPAFAPSDTETIRNAGSRPEMAELELSALP